MSDKVFDVSELDVSQGDQVFGQSDAHRLAALRRLFSELQVEWEYTKEQYAAQMILPQEMRNAQALERLRQAAQRIARMGAEVDARIQELEGRNGNQ